MTAPRSSITEGVLFLKVTEIARELGVSKMTVYRLMYSKRLYSIRVGRSYRVPVAAYEAFLEGAAYTPPQPAA